MAGRDPDEESDVIVARWTESATVPLSTGSADALVLEAFHREAEPLGVSGRWRRQMADPCLTATSSGSFVRRHADLDAADKIAAGAAAVAGEGNLHKHGGAGEPKDGQGDGEREGARESDVGGWFNVGSGGRTAMRWRDLFAARELWDAISYDTWNGTYPQLAFLAADERPGDPEKLEALQRKEDDGTLTEKEAEELWYRQELQYDVMFGLFPAAVLPDHLQHMATRVIFVYVRLTPPSVTYTPDMHRVLAPLLYIAMRDPEHGLRDTMIDRELHLAATGHDHVEAQALAMFLSFSSQVFRHWGPIEGSGGLDVAGLLAARAMDRVFQIDEELALKLWGPMGLGGNSSHKLSADDLLRPPLATLFACSLPLPELLPLWEAMLAGGSICLLLWRREPSVSAVRFPRREESCCLCSRALSAACVAWTWAYTCCCTYLSCGGTVSMRYPPCDDCGCSLSPPLSPSLPFPLPPSLS